MNFFRRIAAGLGYDVLRVEKYHPTLESHLKQVLENLGIGVVIDVGANNGGYGRMLRQIGYQGHILSFEPVEAAFEALCARASGDARWHCRNHALGSKEEEIYINVPQSDDFASFLEATDRAKEIWEKDFSQTSRQKVQVKTLDQVYDDLIRPLQSDGAAFLKMDTQGFDLQVFQGAGTVLGRIQGIQSEVSVFPIYKEMPDFMTSLSCFRKAGFEITGLYPVSRNPSDLTVIEFDCVMVRKPSGRPGDS
jgi:FkbM family methyltransferase